MSKPLNCTLCGGETNDPKGICGACKVKIEAGLIEAPPVASGDSFSPANPSECGPGRENDKVFDGAFSALVHMGFKKEEAIAALHKAQDEGHEGLDTLVKAATKILTTNMEETDMAKGKSHRICATEGCKKPAKRKWGKEPASEYCKVCLKKQRAPSKKAPASPQTAKASVEIKDTTIAVDIPKKLYTQLHSIGHAMGMTPDDVASRIMEKALTVA